MNQIDTTLDAAPISLDDRLLEVEASLITWAFEVSLGNKSKAAALLKVGRSTLGDRISRCGLGRAVARVDAEGALATAPVTV